MRGNEFILDILVPRINTKRGHAFFSIRKVIVIEVFAKVIRIRVLQGSHWVEIFHYFQVLEMQHVHFGFPQIFLIKF